MKPLSRGGTERLVQERARERTGIKARGQIGRLLAEHGGDVHAAIAALTERSLLIKELEFASLATMFERYTRCVTCLVPHNPAHQ